ncbi:hypothetical protein, partial [Streptococcus agalactiae]|uniref:hypothetical protein n=1 Tax=Streptococcus agalactiae TaxID=1311 RepID=UPI0010720B0D
MNSTVEFNVGAGETGTATFKYSSLIIEDDRALGSATYLALLSLAGINLQAPLPFVNSTVEFNVGAGETGTATFKYSSL